MEGRDLALENLTVSVRPQLGRDRLPIGQRELTLDAQQLAASLPISSVDSRSRRPQTNLPDDMQDRHDGLQRSTLAWLQRLLQE